MSKKKNTCIAHGHGPTLVPVVLVEESLRVVLLVIEPVHPLRYELLPRLLPFPATWDRGGQTGMVLSNGVVGPRRDEVPNEGFNVLVPAVRVKAVQQGQAQSILHTSKIP
jgi:hypothetical protein